MTPSPHENDFQYPPALEKGENVAVFAPASPFDADALEKGVAIWTKRGFNVHLHEGLFERTGYFAGSDKHRADFFNKIIADPDIKAVVAARGGYGSLRIMDLIDYEKLRIHPKIFIGFSDVTALLFEIYRLCRLVTFSGPMIAGRQFAKSTTEELDVYFQTIMDKNPPQSLGGPNAIKLTPGRAKGPLLGGNLTLINQLAAAKRLPDLKGTVLLLEDTKEEPYRIDRMLTSLKIGGYLSNVAGVACGSFGPDITDDKLSEIIIDCLGELNVPIVIGLEIGHHGINRLVPLGAPVEITEDKPELIFLESPVC